MERSRRTKLRSVVTIVPFLLSLAGAGASATGGGGSAALFSLDRDSPSGVGTPDPADIYVDDIFDDSTLTIALSRTDLQLPLGTDIDALSSGNDNGVPVALAGIGAVANPLNAAGIRYQFSADRGAQDHVPNDRPVPIPFAAAQLVKWRTDFPLQFPSPTDPIPDHEADIFDNQLIVGRWNWPVVPEEFLELIGRPSPVRDNVDAFESAGSFGAPLDTNTRVFISVDRLTAQQTGNPEWDPATVYVRIPGAPGPTWPVYASAANLGLQAGDNIDGFCVWDGNQNAIFDPGDGIVFSLDAQSPSLPISFPNDPNNVPVGEGGILLVDGSVPGVIVTALPAGYFALRDPTLDGFPEDNLDEIKCWDPGPGGEEERGHVKPEGEDDPEPEGQATETPTPSVTVAPPRTSTTTPTATASRSRTPTATRTRSPLPPLRLDPLPGPIVVGSSSTLTGSGFTPGSVVVMFVATGLGPVTFGPFTPTARTATALTWFPPATIPLGQGYASVVVVNTDQNYLQSNAQGQLLRGAPGTNIPTILAINGVACSPADPGTPIANVETVVVPGSTVTLDGTGFNGALVALFSAARNHGPLTPLPGASATRLRVVVPGDVPTGPGAFQVVNSPYVGNVGSNAVSVPLGARVSISAVTQVGPTVFVDGTGFSSTSVVGLFNLQGTTVVNLGGFHPDGSARIPLTVTSSTRLSFTVPTTAMPGPAYVQVLNPPFIAYSSSGSDPDGAFTLRAQDEPQRCCELKKIEIKTGADAKGSETTKEWAEKLKEKLEEKAEDETIGKVGAALIAAYEFITKLTHPWDLYATLLDGTWVNKGTDTEPDWVCEGTEIVCRVIPRDASGKKVGMPGGIGGSENEAWPPNSGQNVVWWEKVGEKALGRALDKMLERCECDDGKNVWPPPEE